MKQYSTDLDSHDLTILRVLQSGNMSNVKLAEHVKLSPPATHSRVKRLEEQGFIQKVVALLDRERLDFDLLCFITVSLQVHNSDEVGQFRDAVNHMPEVLECYHVTGDYDYILKVALRNRTDLQRFLMDNLTPLPYIAHIHTRIALTEVKHTTALPLGSDE